MKITLQQAIKRLSSMDGAVEDMSVEEVEEEIMTSVSDLEDALSDLEDIGNYIGQIRNALVDLDSFL